MMQNIHNKFEQMNAFDLWVGSAEHGATHDKQMENQTNKKAPKRFTGKWMLFPRALARTQKLVQGPWKTKKRETNKWIDKSIGKASMYQ